MKKLKFIVLFLFLCGTSVTQAQWSIGVKGGVDRNMVVRSNAGRLDETYHAKVGTDFGIFGRYQFNECIGLRADFSVMSRSHTMRRNLNYVKPTYTDYKNSYIMLPVMADITVGFEKLHFHLMGGAFAAYWLSAKRSGMTNITVDDVSITFDEKIEFNKEHNRFCAGVAAGAGVNYDITDSYAIELDALFYYDMTSYMKVDKIVAEPRYHNTLSLTLGLIYKL